METPKEKVIQLINKELEENYELINDEKNYYHDDIQAVKIQTNFLTKMLLEVEEIPDNESALIKRNEEVTDEREVLIKAFADITKEFKGRDWITDGRGPYSFDDEGYRKEVSYLFDAFKKIERQVWSNIKSKTFEYKNQIQEPLIKRNEELEAMLEEIDRRYYILATEPNGIVRETMIGSLTDGITELLNKPK